MDPISLDQLRSIMPRAREEDLADFCDPLNAAMEKYEIDTPDRQAAFLAQITEESDQLWHQRAHYHTERGEEYASGKAYEERTDLGNTPEDDGDGPLYKGRGLLQVTGRANYQKLTDKLGEDFVANPQLLLDPAWSCEASADYWHSHGCNELADAGKFVTITRRINGGTNGLAERQAFWAAAKAALAI